MARFNNLGLGGSCKRWGSISLVLYFLFLWLPGAAFGESVADSGCAADCSPSQSLAASTEFTPASGLWANPNPTGQGHGIDLELSGPNLILVYYTHKPTGGPVWYLASGALDGTNWTADLYHYTWNAETSTTSSSLIGSVNVEFTDITHAIFSWTINGKSGSEPIVYSTFAEEMSPANNYTGTWYVETIPGYGFSFVHHGDTLVAIHYLYDDNGEPIWALGAANIPGFTSGVPVSLDMDTFTGSCPNCPFEAPVAAPAGTLSITFTSPNAGTLSASISQTTPVDVEWTLNNVSITMLSDPVDADELQLALNATKSSQATAADFLSVQDVQRIIAQATTEATARGTTATTAVVDRVGNVLGVFQMNGATDPVTITSLRNPLVQTGLENVNIIPASLAAIAKAISGAFLSSEGNAFTTRTANQIVQEHFNPREVGQNAGPLFGVQFGSLPCSDLNTRFVSGVGASVGPQRSPLGLSADPGGLPLYKNGTPVGGIGVISDGIYGLDLNITNRDTSDDELIALAGTFGFEAPTDRRADRITVEGKIFRFTDKGFDKVRSNPANAPDFGSINGVNGNLQAVIGYSDGLLVRGTAFGQPRSGIRPDNGEFFPGQNIFVLVDPQNVNRFPPRVGTNLSQAEVQQMLSSALDVAFRARAQIRRPLNSPVEVTVSVVDVNGDILGVARSPDAPVFGIDVSLQKARTAAFLSSPGAASSIANASDAIYFASGTAFPVSSYLTATQAFFQDPNVLTGQIAFSDRAGGNLSRPFYPDGIIGRSNGPFSKPFPEWSPFSTGFQLDSVINGVLSHVAFVLGLTPNDVGMDCTNPPQATVQALLGLAGISPQDFTFGAPIPAIRNGIQIFPGSVPIYRGNVLVGGLGVSGDGVDQDDLVAFLGLHNAGVAMGTINNAPKNIRADNLKPRGVRLRFVQCPVAPFRNSQTQNICHGK